MNEDSTILQCPICEHTRFSWIAEVVQFGNIHRFEHDDGSVTYSEEALENGEYVGDHVEDEGVFCNGCETYYLEEELEPVGGETETVAVDADVLQRYMEWTYWDSAIDSADEEIREAEQHLRERAGLD